LTEYENRIRRRLSELKFGLDGIALSSDAPLLDDILDSEKITELGKVISAEIGRPLKKEERIATNFFSISAILRFSEAAKLKS
jgi:hypothetical protein